MDEKKEILFAGDPHGNFQPVVDAVNRFKPKAIILLGDYELKQPLECYINSILNKTQIWWIPGNHDFEPQIHYHNLFNSKLADRGLHLKVREIAGVRIAGLGGIFLGRVWYPPSIPKWKSKDHFLSKQKKTTEKSSLSLKYKSAIWPDEWADLKKIKADILVTHEAPKSHRHGFVAIDQLAESMGVKKVFHGHLHEHYSAKIRRGIDVYGVANARVVDLSGNQLE